MKLRVATFNILNSAADDSWRHRRDSTIAAIRALDAEVIGLQEVLPEQFAFLRSAFSSWHLIGVGREDGDRVGEQAAVLVRPGRWSVEECETRWLSESPSRPGSVSWDADRPRVAALVRLRHRDGSRIGIVSTHFDHAGEVARFESARLLTEWLGAEAERPWVILGDLNAAPGSPALRLLTEAGWRDALPEYTGGSFHELTGATGGERIDHILVGPGWRVTHAFVSHHRPGGRLPSDHWPVVADLVLDRRPGPNR